MPQNRHQKKADRRKREFERAQNSKPKPVPETRRRDTPRGNGRIPLYATDLGDGTYRLECADSGNTPELKHLDGFEFRPQHGHDLASAMFLEIAKAHIPLDSLEECSELGHPRQAWAALSNQQPEAEPCSKCGREPEFVEYGWSGSVRGFLEESITEELDDEQAAEHAIIESVEGGNLFFRFESRRL